MFLCAKSHMHIFNMLEIPVHSFKIECLKTLRRVDYTIFLPLTETKPQNCLSQQEGHDGSESLT